MKRIPPLAFLLIALLPTSAAIRVLQLEGNVFASTDPKGPPSRLTLTNTFVAPITFRAETNAFVDLEILKNSRIRVLPGSTVTIERAKLDAKEPDKIFDISLELQKGRVHCFTEVIHREAKFEVGHPMGACGARD